MSKATLKTQPTAASVDAFLAAIADAQRRDDCRALASLMTTESGAAPRLWGGSIVGFGDVSLTYASGRELDWFRCGFASRKDGIALYGLVGGADPAAALIARLGKHKAGKGCLTIKRLSDVDATVLRALVKRAAVAQPAPAASPAPARAAKARTSTTRGKARKVLP